MKNTGTSAVPELLMGVAKQTYLRTHTFAYIKFQIKHFVHLHIHKISQPNCNQFYNVALVYVWMVTAFHEQMLLCKLVAALQVLCACYTFQIHVCFFVIFHVFVAIWLSLYCYDEKEIKQKCTANKQPLAAICFTMSNRYIQCCQIERNKRPALWKQAQKKAAWFL